MSGHPSWDSSCSRQFPSCTSAYSGCRSANAAAPPLPPLNRQARRRQHSLGVGRRFKQSEPSALSRREDTAYMVARSSGANDAARSTPTAPADERGASLFSPLLWRRVARTAWTNARGMHVPLGAKISSVNSRSRVAEGAPKTDPAESGGGDYFHRRRMSPRPRSRDDEHRHFAPTTITGSSTF